MDLGAEAGDNVDVSDTTTCAVVGGGPAGLFLALMLARAGVEVTVLEKHADFLRDFRGDTVHPVTMRLLDELGLFERFDRLPQSRVEKGQFDVDGQSVHHRRLPSPPLAAPSLCGDGAAMGSARPDRRCRQGGAHLLGADASTTSPACCAMATGSPACVTQAPDGQGELRADLVVGCDGRTSVVRRDAGLPIREYPVPFDVWWFRLPRDQQAQYSLIPRTKPGRALIMIPREGYFQIAYLIPKGSDAELRARGLDAFHRELAELIPESSPEAITSWDDVKVLDVRLDRLRRWHGDGRAVHRRCCTCHVAGRRGRHQSGDRRRRCRGRLSGGTASDPPPHDQASRRGTSASITAHGRRPKRCNASCIALCSAPRLQGREAARPPAAVVKLLSAFPS